MKVKLRGLLASPTRICNPGSIVDFPDDEAKHLIATGQADPVEEPKQPTPVKEEEFDAGEIETAESVKPANTASTRKSNRK